MFTLAFTPLAKINPKLTRAVFVAATAPHTNKLAARRQRWQTRG